MLLHMLELQAKMERITGIGIDHDIIRASIDALESAMNRSIEA